MKVLLDMNLSPLWVSMAWARDHDSVVITHDIDFSALLAATDAAGPSVLLIRTHDVLPESIGSAVVRVLRSHGEALEQGAIVSLDEAASRVRVLPIRRR